MWPHLLDAGALRRRDLLYSLLLGSLEVADTPGWAFFPLPSILASLTPGSWLLVQTGGGKFGRQVPPHPHGAYSLEDHPRMDSVCPRTAAGWGKVVSCDRLEGQRRARVGALQTACGHLLLLEH